MMTDLGAELLQDLHFDNYAQEMLENGQSWTTSMPTISTTLSSSVLLHKLSVSILSSLQAVTEHAQQDPMIVETSTDTDIGANSSTHGDFDVLPNQVAIDSSTFGAMDELQKQLQYDKFMNEVWIGVVFTLILISTVFCICSCFLYHQFRTWKRNFNAAAARAHAQDIESMKLNADYYGDPVPEYTLVSGLPSYEAALKELQRNSNGSVFAYPTVFTVFNKLERSCNSLVDMMTTTAHEATETETASTSGVQQRQHHSINETQRSLIATETAVRSFFLYDSSINNDNDNSDNIINDNINSDNIIIDNINSDNINTGNINSDNINTGNINNDNINSDNMNNDNINNNNINNDKMNNNNNNNDKMNNNDNNNNNNKYNNDSNIPSYSDAATAALLSPSPSPAAAAATTTKPFSVFASYPPVLQKVHSYDDVYEALLPESDARL